MKKETKSKCSNTKGYLKFYCSVTLIIYYTYCFLPCQNVHLFSYLTFHCLSAFLFPFRMSYILNINFNIFVFKATRQYEF